MSPEEKKKEAGEEQAAEAKSPPSTAASPFRLVGVLTSVCIGAGVALAGGYAATVKQIAQQRYRFKLASVKKVLPPCENDPGKDTVQVALASGKKTTVYRCRRSGKIIALAFSRDSEANKNAPYSGKIELLVGIETGKNAVVKVDSPRRVGVLVLKHSETPGLGAKIEEYGFLKQYAHQRLDKQGRSCIAAAQCRLWAVTKDDAMGFVDAISGATISSRAVTEIVRRALTDYMKPDVRAAMTKTEVKQLPRPADARKSGQEIAK